MARVFTPPASIVLAERNGNASLLTSLSVSLWRTSRDAGPARPRHPQSSVTFETVTFDRQILAFVSIHLQLFYTFSSWNNWPLFCTCSLGFHSMIPTNGKSQTKNWFRWIVGLQLNIIYIVYIFSGVAGCYKLFVRRSIIYSFERTRGTRGSVYCFFSQTKLTAIIVNRQWTPLGTDSKRIYTALQIDSKKQSVWLFFCQCKSVWVCGFVWVRVCMICLLMTLGMLWSRHAPVLISLHTIVCSSVPISLWPPSSA